jgi:hypothetical protein
MTVTRRSVLAVSLMAAAGCALSKRGGGGPLQAGAASVDVSPVKLPAIVNGSFAEKTAAKVMDRLHARAVVLDDGREKLAIVVVDSCMMPRELIEAAKQMAAERTGMAVERMLVSATHTHSAPAAMGALGSSVDEAYAAWLPGKIAEAIEKAWANRAEAEVGWTSVHVPDHTYCRRWITRPDKMLVDPFGEKSVRAMMHPGYQNGDYLGPSGPVDDELTLLCVRAAKDRHPMAVLANYSMHYVGAPPVSADYFGRFCEHLARVIGADERFVAMMSQGTSGDQHWMNYGGPRPNPAPTADGFAQEMAGIAKAAYERVAYRGDVTLAMAETKLTLKRRTPDAKRLAWAKETAAKLGDKKPVQRPDIYAREALYLAAEPVRELKLQAIRIGDFGITAIPDEVFGITGLKLKLQSPLAGTMNVELANGSEGYIPPPEQHALGGYTTWPARTAALEVGAEPAITEAVLKLLEQVSGRPRKKIVDEMGEYARAVLASKPAGYWRMSAINYGPLEDVSGHGRRAYLKGKAAMFLEGPGGKFGGVRGVNRAVQLCGGTIMLDVPVGQVWTVELWVCDYLGDRVWRHVVISGDRVWVDGRWVSKPPISVEAGRQVVIGRGFEGRVDEVAIYERALKGEEIEGHLERV